jgi:hypothetical protein
MSWSEKPSTIRELYEEFQLGEITVSMITDPENSDAWIQSNVSQSIDP